MGLYAAFGPLFVEDKQEISNLKVGDFVGRT